MLSLPPQSSLLWIGLCVAAVWRLTALFCYDAGPFGAITRVRGWLVRIGLAGLISCFHCCALWMSTVIVLLVFERQWLSVILILAVAGMASTIERWLGGTPAHLTEE